MNGELCVFLVVVMVVVMTGVLSSPPGDADQVLCARQHCHCIGTNVTCHFSGQQVVLGEYAVPVNTTQLQLHGNGGHLRMRPRAIGGARNLKFVLASGWKHLVVDSGAIAGNLADDAVMEIVNGNQVILETSSLQMTGALTVILSNLLKVEINGRTFQRLNALRVDKVHELKLESNAFKMETSQESLQNKVIVSKTTIPDIPADTFPSAVGEVYLVGCVVDRIDSNAFPALRYDRLVFANSTIKRIAGAALSERTLVAYLAIDNCTIEFIHSGAIQAAVTHMHVDRSRLIDVAGSAINATIARFEMKNSVLRHLRAEAVQLRDWSNLVLDNNWFARMDTDAMTAPVTTSDAMFRCVGNTFGEVQYRAMFLRLSSGGGIGAEIEHNHFTSTCRCGIKDDLRNFLGAEVAVDAGDFFNTSSCMIDKVLALCVAQAQEGVFPMKDFERAACGDAGNALNQCVASLLSEHTQPPQSAGDDDGAFQVEDDLQGRERTLIFLVFGAGLVGAASVAAASCVTWIARRDPCGSLGSRIRQLRQHLIPPPSMGVVPAASISRLPVDEYQRRHTDTAVTTLSDAEIDDEVVWAPSEDKSTQTMPEELTQELLQTLRAKLDDPHNYNEACVIIEHLYDLIKVEETNAASSAGASNENLYDVITPRRRPTAPIVAMASVGTRAPSPGALPPAPTRAPSRAPARAPPAVCDYAEPSDARVHLYSELPGENNAPGHGTPTLVQNRDYGIANHANRPLPSRPKL